MESPKTLLEAIKTFSDYDNCREFMAFLRWPDGKVRCPTCDSEKVGYLEKARTYVCYEGHKKPKFSLKVGTVFEDSPIALEKWLPAVWMLVNDKNGISSWELHRALGVTQKSAWFMLHRIRTALKSGGFVSKMGGRYGGPIEMDETFVGGRAKNMHRARRIALQEGLKAGQKTAVVGMLERNTRQVRAKVIPNVKRETLQNEILSNIERKSTVYTDSYAGYDHLNVRDFVHETVNHMEEYVRGEVHTSGYRELLEPIEARLEGNLCCRRAVPS